MCFGCRKGCKKSLEDYLLGINLPKPSNDALIETTVDEGLDTLGWSCFNVGGGRTSISIGASNSVEKEDANEEYFVDE